MTGSTTPDLLDDLRRALAGRYDVERLLGAGGMGSVYLGRDVTLDRPVAIKVVAPELAASKVIRERFLQEARTVARLRHPNIVAVYAAGESDGLLYFVMEYVAGESLRALLEREGRFEDERAVVVLRDLARALAYAHEHGVVHRDVKPENVLLDAGSGCAMLTDFGVARALAAGGDGGRLTGTGFVLGSPRYMSPEQASGERELDGRSDVYSLGLVGYEMFAGEPAITATSAATMLVKQLTEVPPPIETRSARVPRVVAEVIGRALEKEPARRWATANEMADVLDAAAAGAPPNTTIAGLGAGRVIRRAPGGANPRPAASGRGRRFAAAGAVALLAVGGAGAWYAARGEGGVPRGVDPRRSYLVAPFEVLTGDPQLGWLREASVSMLSTNLAQWNDVAVVDYERSLDLLRDANLDGAARIGLEDAQRMARRAGAWTVVMGQVTNTPDSLIVVARVYDVASGRRVDEAQRSAARAADPRPLYDALARDLLDLAGAPANIALGTLAETTTPSVEAYRAYLDGLRALNGWQLARADSLFRRATQADTAFALAYYKRALTMGWQSAGDTAQRTLVALALRHSARLLPRDRDLVSAYADLTGALTHADSAESNAAFLSAQRKYAAIIARDSSAAEAWYGLGDAYFHHQPNPSAQVANWSRALRAFNRTLALDSTFHLAFSHKVQIYQNAASPAVPVLLDGDSLRPLFTDADRRALGPARIQQARDSARQLATRDARAWVAVDPAPQAYQALADLYMSIGQYDSAAAVVREAMATPSARSPILPFYEVALLMRTDPAAAPAALRAVLRTTSAAELAAGGGSDRFFAILNAAGAAMLGGRASDVRAAMSLAAAVQPMLPGLGYSTPAMTRWFAVGAELALGMPPAPLRVALDSGARFIDRLPGAPRGSIQTQSMSVPYVAYLVTRDPRFLAVVRRWQRPDAAPLTELDALEALTAGDTARALQAARAFPSPDSVRAATGARVGAMRWVARAEVLAGLGDARRALGMYDVLDPTRFAAAGPLDLSWALYPRSFLARGRLYEQLGERESAAAAYTRFVELWKDADPALQPQLREAREGLGRVRDLPSTISAR